MHREPPTDDRRESFIKWSQHVDDRLDSQDATLKAHTEKLDRVLEALDYYNFAKVGVTVIKWLAMVGAAVLAGWAAIHPGAK